MDIEKKEQGVEILASPEKMIPKYASSVNFKKLENGNIIMSFLVSQDGKVGSLIETILVDTKHAKEISEVLLKVSNE
jgi:hypothetical protein